MGVWKLPNWCTNFEKLTFWATSTKLILTNIPTVQYSTKDPSGTLHEPNFPTIVCSYLASGYCCLVVVGLFQPCWDDTPKEIMCFAYECTYQDWEYKIGTLNTISMHSAPAIH